VREHATAPASRPARKVPQSWADQIPGMLSASPQPCVYYLRFGDRIKIGTTSDLKTRLTGVPHDEVLALEPGSYDVERARQRQFGALWIRREWYRPGEALLAHIAAVRERYADFQVAAR